MHINWDPNIRASVCKCIIHCNYIARNIFQFYSFYVVVIVYPILYCYFSTYLSIYAIWSYFDFALKWTHYRSINRVQYLCGLVPECYQSSFLCSPDDSCSGKVLPLSLHHRKTKVCGTAQMRPDKSHTDKRENTCK